MDPVTQFPAKPLGEVLAYKRACAILEEGLLLIPRRSGIRINFEELVGVYRKLRKKILGVFVHTAEPHGTDDCLDSFNLGDFVPVGNRQGIEEGNPMTCHESERGV